MDISMRHTRRLRTFALGCVLAGACVAFSAVPAYADEATDTAVEAPLAQLEVVAEAPLAELEAMTADIKDHLTEAAEEAAEVVAEREREGRRAAVVEAALGFRGVPYVWGGTRPSGFDCSGLTQWVYRETLGIELPRLADKQGNLGESVPMDELLPGDLLFWGRGSGVYHVAIYAGDGEYVHASSGKGRVVRQGMEYFRPTFAKRFI